MSYPVYQIICAMSDPAFTDEQLADWVMYERVRLSGLHNMFMPSARESTGLTEPRYLSVMANYTQLKDAVEKAGRLALYKTWYDGDT